MAVNLSPVGGVAAQFFTNSGVPLTGGKIFTYAAGTTTPQASYTTSQGNVAWTNPIVLDAAGRVPSGGEIWLTDGLIYKFVLKDSNDVLIATYDNITGINSNSVAYTNQQEIVTATAGQTVFNLGISYQPATNSLSVFVDGVNQYGPGAQYSYVETDSNTVTFNAGLHVGAEVKFTTTQQQGAGAVDASQVTYDPPFTGSVITNVEAKLAQTVSVKDFGAVCDFDLNTNTGTDDTAAIQAAIDWCSANGKTLLQVGLSKITTPLTNPASLQLHVVGIGDPRTFDSGWVYRGVGTMMTGNGQDRSLAFVNFENMLFEGPGIGSGVDCFYGDFYQGGAFGCLFRNWRTCITTYGSINTFKANRFFQNVNGIILTNWPSDTTQPSVSTTTFVSERNNYYGNTGYGLKVDTTGTGGADLISSVSRDDVFEQNGVGFYLNKSFDFLLERPHFEFHVTAPLQIINSSPNVLTWYVHPSDVPNISITWPGASANQAGYNNFNNNGTSLTRQLTLTTKGINIATFSATDGGGVEWSGAGVVGTWTPRVGSTTGTSVTSYSRQQGNYTRIGNLVIATFNVKIAAKPAGMTGFVNIFDLPFAVENSLFQSYGNALTYDGITFSGGAFTQLNCDAINGTLRAQPIKLGSGLAPAYLDPSEMSGTATFAGTIIYIADPL